jgi:hypothetical protein
VQIQEAKYEEGGACGATLDARDKFLGAEKENREIKASGAATGRKGEDCRGYEAEEGRGLSSGAPKAKTLKDRFKAASLVSLYFHGKACSYQLDTAARLGVPSYATQTLP